jgi:hypothetical protein
MADMPLPATVSKGGMSSLQIKNKISRNRNTIAGIVLKYPGFKSNTLGYSDPKIRINIGISPTTDFTSGIAPQNFLIEITTLFTNQFGIAYVVIIISTEIY